MLITNDPYKTAGQLLDVTVLVPAWRNGRVIALFGSTIHHTDVGGYGIGAGGRDVFEEGLWIPIVKLMRRRRAQRRRVEVHPLQRPPARPHGRRPPRPDGVGRGRRPAAEALCDQHGLDDIEALADEIIERSEAATRAGIRELPAGTHHASAVLDLADGSRDRHRLRAHGRPRGGRDHRRLHRLLRRQPVGHQRRQELHPRLHHVHRALGAQPRHPQQPRQPGADQGRSPRGLDRQRRVAAAVHGPPRRRACSCPTRCSRRSPRSARAGDGGGLGRRVDDAGQRHPRRRQPVHHGDVHVRRRRRRPGRASPASTPARTRPASPPCRSRSSRRRRRSASRRKALRPGSGGAGRADRRARPDDRVHRRHHAGRGSSTPSPAAWPRRHRASSAASRARPAASASTARPSPPRPASPCSPTTSCASTSRAAAATASRGRARPTSEAAIG